MGGGLAFLNKKGWHPGSLRNQEAVWKKEQEKDAEDRKLDEFKQHVELERQKEELEGLAKAAGIKKQSDRLDWMYQGGMVARQAADERVEASAQQELPGPPAGVPVQAAQGPPVQVKLPAFLEEDNPASANEIRQQEIAARKSVLANPVQMDAIKRQAEQAKVAKVLRKAAKKEAKQARKAKKARKEKHREPDSDSDLEPARPQQASHRRHDSEDPEPRPSSHRHHSSEAAAPQHRQNGERPAHRAANGEAAQLANGHHHDSSGSRRQPNGKSLDREEAERQYGLRQSGAAPQEVRDKDRSDARLATERHLEAAAKAREAREAEEKANRYVRKEHRPGQLSEAEKAKRLAEMSGNANVHEEARWDRLANARKRDRAADEDPAQNGVHDAAKFRKTAVEQVQMADTLETGIGRRKFYSEKGNDSKAYKR